MIAVTMTNNKTLDMKGNAAVRQLLLDTGFKIVGTCNCSGQYTVKMNYDTTSGMMKIHVRAHTYLLQLPGAPGFTKHPISKLQTQIDEIKRDYEPHIAAPQA